MMVGRGRTTREWLLRMEVGQVVVGRGPPMMGGRASVVGRGAPVMGRGPPVMRRGPAMMGRGAATLVGGGGSGRAGRVSAGLGYPGTPVGLYRAEAWRSPRDMTGR